MNAPTLVVNEHADRDAWLEARRTGIGSSDAPAILGIPGAFGSAYKISALKLGLLGPEDDDESELLKWGHYSEGPMIEAFSDETGWSAKRSGDMFRSGDPERDFQLATIDGVCQRDDGKVGGIECKLKIFGADEWERDGVPDFVVCQTQHTMGVMGWDWMVVLALLDGYRLRWKIVERQDDVIGDVIVPSERTFWQRILDGELADASIGRPDATADALKRLYPEDSGATIALEGDEYLRALAEWQQARDDEKAAKRRKDAAKNLLVAGMKDATFAQLDNGSMLTLKTTRRGEFVTKASSFRVLRQAK